MRTITALAMAALTTLTAAPGKNIPVYRDATRPLEERVEDALSRMATQEKIDIIHAQSKFCSKGVPRLGIPELWTTDGPHGIRPEVLWDEWDQARWTNDSCVAFPALTCLAASWNPEVSRLYGESMGEEARFRGKDVVLGPGVNIYRTPVNGRNFEYMGEDPYLASVMVVPYIRAAYNLYRDEHLCHNGRMLNDILKKEWGFDGAVISDWGGTHDTYQAIVNGLDLEFGSWTDGLANGASNAYDNYYMARPYLEMIKEGKVGTAELDDKARRVLRLIMRTAMDYSKGDGEMCSDAHYAAARRIGDEGIVLLRNEGHVLPLPRTAGKRILVVGENAIKMMTVGGGSSSLKVQREISPLDGIRTATQLIADAVAKARQADYVVFVGGLNKSAGQDCEDADRAGLGLPYGQDEVISALAAANPRLVVVNVSGNAVAMPWVGKVPAIVQAWFLGSESGHSIADVLFGEVNPSGKLPFTFPMALEDNAAHALGAYPGVQREDSPILDLDYSEGILVGYRWHDTKKIKPLFAFGHGLSYTDFRFGKMSADRTEVSADGTVTFTVPVTNTGAVAGAEVVQLYISDPKCSVERPAKELKGFAKVYLQPGETRDVTLTVDREALSYFDPDRHEWVAEPGQFVASAGPASDDIKTTVKFNLK